jgi:two-component system, OmpR family, phosphate regulon sensor histidine kinase PhoR
LKLSLQWKWFGVLALLVAALLVFANIGIGFYLSPNIHQTFQTDLKRNLIILSHQFEGPLANKPRSESEIDLLARQLSAECGFRITVIEPQGRVLAESDVAPGKLNVLENHLLRPEIQDARQYGFGSSVRRSATVDKELLYVARALLEDGTLVGFVRVAVPMEEVSRVISHVRRTVALASFGVLLLSLPIVFWMAHRFVGPIDQMRLMARRVSKGNFQPLKVDGMTEELSELGLAMNEMASQLQTRLKELSEERLELRATLANMMEGVILVDRNGRIRLANSALREQFGFNESIDRKTILEAFRNEQLHLLVDKALNGVPFSDQELTFFGPKDRVFHVNAAALRTHDDSMGAVVVFHEITRLKQLENMRKDFVANVSHELRTPLSIIKGYVETLLDEPDSKAEARSKQFLQIIQKHSNRLENLINDLLTISSLESQQAQLELETYSLARIAKGVVDELSRQASGRATQILLEIPDSLQVRVDAKRVHQVFFNLIENALKYTPPQCTIRIQASGTTNEVTVCVRDNGQGIPAEHLPHIFERFYRVEKARSREQGGTGLGLSIVKHIVLAHGGRVWAESTPGQGASFFFTLPKPVAGSANGTSQAASY